jgi:hypothetical protein
MPNEFDELLEPMAANGRGTVTREGTPSSRLVARLFAAAGNPLRARLLACLMRPLGPLGLAGVAAGAFAAFVSPRDGSEPRIDLEAVAQLSSRQVHELAHFVEQVNPQALQQFASLVSSSPLAMATFSASALALLYRRLQPGAALRPGVRPPA